MQRVGAGGAPSADHRAERGVPVRRPQDHRVLLVQCARGLQGVREGPVLHLQGAHLDAEGALPRAGRLRSLLRPRAADGAVLPSGRSVLIAAPAASSAACPSVCSGRGAVPQRARGAGASGRLPQLPEVSSELLELLVRGGLGWRYCDVTIANGFHLFLSG